jgi:hypothetical protein
MNRRDRIRPKMADLSRAVRLTIPFLRMAAIEVRRIADGAPEVAERLRIVADQLDAEADDLSRLPKAPG